jgi:membrane associated rhomboid family serine protease
MGAYILKFPSTRIVTLIPLGFFFTTVRIPAFFFLGFWFLQQAFNSFATLDMQAHVGMEGGSVAYWAHAGGFVFGALIGSLFGLLSNKSDPYTQQSQR